MANLTGAIKQNYLNNTKLGIFLKINDNIEKAANEFVAMIQSAAKLSSKSSQNFRTIPTNPQTKYLFPKQVISLFRQKINICACWKAIEYLMTREFSTILLTRLKENFKPIKTNPTKITF